MCSLGAVSQAESAGLTSNCLTGYAIGYCKWCYKSLCTWPLLTTNTPLLCPKTRTIIPIGTITSDGRLFRTAISKKTMQCRLVTLLYWQIKSIIVMLWHETFWSINVLNVLKHLCMWLASLQPRRQGFIQLCWWDFQGQNTSKYCKSAVLETILDYFTILNGGESNIV